jgi:hypothetical protein
MEFSRIIDQICWSWAFSLTYHVCLRIFYQICWAFAFSRLRPTQLILVGLGNQRFITFVNTRGLVCSFDHRN